MSPTKRVCGGCTACCKALPVFEIDKPRGRWCIHCNIGNGCNIYSIRPKNCEAFECQWLKGHGADNLRPDISKVVIDFQNVLGLGNIGIIWEVAEGALARTPAQDTTKRFIDNGIPVCHKSLSGKDVIFIPREAQEAGISTDTLRLLTDEGARVFIVDTPC